MACKLVAFVLVSPFFRIVIIAFCKLQTQQQTGPVVEMSRNSDTECSFFFSLFLMFIFE